MGFWGNFSAALSQAGQDLGKLRDDNRREKWQQIEQDRQQKLLEMAIARDKQEQQRYADEQIRRRAQDAIETGTVTPESADVIKQAGLGHRIKELEGPTQGGQPLYGINLTPDQKRAEIQAAQQNFLYQQAQDKIAKQNQLQEAIAALPSNASPDARFKLYEQAGLAGDFAMSPGEQFAQQKTLASIRNQPDPPNRFQFLKGLYDNRRMEIATHNNNIVEQMKVVNYQAQNSQISNEEAVAQINALRGQLMQMPSAQEFMQEGDALFNQLVNGRGGQGAPIPAPSPSPSPVPSHGGLRVGSPRTAPDGSTRVWNGTSWQPLPPKR